MQIPKRLRKEPLIEAIWQLEFSPDPDQPIGDLLPGVMFSALKAYHPKIKLLRLPAADIPQQIALNDPNLRNSVKYRIEEEGSPYLFQVGNRVVTVNCKKPYAGWASFKEKIFQVFDIIRNSNLIPQPERQSLRYIDLLNLRDASDLTVLRLNLNVGEFLINNAPIQLRIELQEDGHIHIVQIISNAIAHQQHADDLIGIVVDMETMSAEKNYSWDDLKKSIDSLHDLSKNMFFKNILTKETIDLLEPEY